MLQTVDEFFAAVKPHVDLFNAWARELLYAALADHICYKCESSQEFETLRSFLGSAGVLINESMISERRIALIKLPKPIPTYLGDIWFLELSDQKPDGSQTSGFDHIEIYPAQTTVVYMIQMLERRNIRFKHMVRPHHTTYDMTLESGLKIRIEDEPLVDKIRREEMKKP